MDTRKNLHINDYVKCLQYDMAVCVPGPSSAQSSTTYAKVSDLTVDPAPVELPVDDLAELSNHGSHSGSLYIVVSVNAVLQ